MHLPNAYEISGLRAISFGTFSRCDRFTISNQRWQTVQVNTVIQRFILIPACSTNRPTDRIFRHHELFRFDFQVAFYTIGIFGWAERLGSIIHIFRLHKQRWKWNDAETMTTTIILLRLCLESVEQWAELNWTNLLVLFWLICRFLLFFTIKYRFCLSDAETKIEIWQKQWREVA